MITNLVNWNNPPAFHTGKPASASGHLATPSPKENEEIVVSATDAEIPLAIDEDRQVQGSEYVQDSEVMEPETTEEIFDDYKEMSTFEAVVESQAGAVASGDEAPILVFDNVEREKWEDATVSSQDVSNEYKLEADGTTDMNASVLVSEDIQEAGMATAGDDAPGRSIITSSSSQ